MVEFNAGHSSHSQQSDSPLPLTNSELTIEKAAGDGRNSEEVADLEAKLEEAMESHAGAAGALESELYKIKLYAGPPQGPGVEVTLDNTPGAN